jgi:hypothetical protein
MFAKLNGKKWNSFGNLSLIVIVIVLTIIGYIAAVLSLLVAFDAIKV